MGNRAALPEALCHLQGFRGQFGSTVVVPGEQVRLREREERWTGVVGLTLFQDPKALLDPRNRLLPAALSQGKDSEQPERNCPIWGRLAWARAERGREPAHRFAAVAPHVPEACQGRDHPECELASAPVEEPPERPPQIVVLFRQPVEPRRLPRSRQLGLGRVGYPQEMLSVPALQLALLAAPAEQVERVLLHCVEHDEARVGATSPSEQTLVDEGREIRHHVLAADRLCRSECAAPHED